MRQSCIYVKRYRHIYKNTHSNLKFPSPEEIFYQGEGLRWGAYLEEVLEEEKEAVEDVGQQRQSRLGGSDVHQWHQEVAHSSPMRKSKVGVGTTASAPGSRLTCSLIGCFDHLQIRKDYVHLSCQFPSPCPRAFPANLQPPGVPGHRRFPHQNISLFSQPSLNRPSKAVPPKLEWGTQPTFSMGM